MVTHAAKVKVSGELIDMAKGLLTGSVSPSSRNTLTVTAKFDNGYEADIKLVQDADSPYLDPVLFDEYGFEVACLQDDSYCLDGTYQFDVDDDTYIVEIVSE